MALRSHRVACEHLDACRELQLLRIVASLLLPCRVVEGWANSIFTSWPMQQSFGRRGHPSTEWQVSTAEVMTHVSPDGFGNALAEEAPTAAASVTKLFPILKDVLAVFGLIDSCSATLSKRLSKPRGTFVLYIGGMIELFYSSPKEEVVFLKERKGLPSSSLGWGPGDPFLGSIRLAVAKARVTWLELMVSGVVDQLLDEKSLQQLLRVLRFWRPHQ
eukprot:Skav233869  [mRNA]  locus=scaffold1483:103477:108306:+ [translate_table: standard]